MTPRAYQRLVDRLCERDRAQMQERLNIMALETAYMANMLAPRKDKKAWQPSDFLPDLEESRPSAQSSGDAPRTPKPRQSVEHMKSILKGLAGALGGEVRERKPGSEEASK